MAKVKKCITGFFIYIFALLLLLFVVIFVIIPVVFKYSVEIQRSVIFPTWYAPYQNYSDIESYGLKGVRNFYITVDNKENITLGTWQILPSALLNEPVDEKYYNYEEFLKDGKYPILLYLHGNGAVRSDAIELYGILRKSFQIIAPDYRGYADSSAAEITENNIVNDILYLYKWIRERTSSRIFVWGHSLGTGISTHLVSNLKAQNIIPTGLVLETPFSTIPDVMEYHFFVKLISWLPWYRATMLDPIVENGFGFESTKYIVDVDCPIMILHAKDDTIVPHELATKLYETAVKSRNVTAQGNVTYHLFEAKGYGHMWIYIAPELPTYVRNFVQQCIEFEKFKKHKST